MSDSDYEEHFNVDIDIETSFGDVNIHYDDDD